MNVNMQHKDLWLEKIPKVNKVAVNTDSRVDVSVLRKWVRNLEADEEDFEYLLWVIGKNVNGYK